jgi:hypothetical protein
MFRALPLKLIFRKLLGGRFEGVPLALPPNIEQLSLLPAPLPDVFPSTLKIVRVGASGNAAFYKSLQSLSKFLEISLFVDNNNII